MSPHDDRTLDFVQRAWDGDIVPALTEYIRIPAKSPTFDANRAEHGHIERAVTLTAIEALQAQGVRHSRCVVLIEASEESGSPDLPFYVEKLAERIRPGLVVCLDSGCGDYDHLWATTSLRGVVSGTLQVEVLREG